MLLTSGTFLSATAPLPIEILLQIIINKYLNSSYCLTFVYELELNLNFKSPVSFTNIIITNGTHFDGLVEHMMNVVEMGCSDYVVRIHKPAVFMEAFDKLNHLATTRRSNKKIIILPYADDETNTKSLLDIITLKETRFVANLLLLLPFLSKTKECTTYDLVTHKFVGPDNEISQPKYLDRWDSCTEEFLKGSFLFPHDDIENLSGKTMRITCFTYKPYVLLDLDSSIVPSGRHGTEIKLVEEFCRWLNCTILIVRADEEQWGQIYENGTGIGVLGNVAEDRADIGITALYSWYEEFLYLDFSCASIRTAVTCIVPAPRLLVSWEMPLLPFSWNMWIGMILMFIFSAVALALAQGCSSDKAFLTVFGILTAQSHDDSMSWRKRKVTGWLILGALILCNAYGAGLASTFTVPKYEKSIDTIQDILDSKLEWGATHDAWVFSLSLSPEPRVQQLVRQFKIYTFEELKRKSFTRSMAYSIEKLPSGSFAIGEYITKEVVQDFMLMKEDFYYEQNVVMLRKSSPYTQKMSNMIARLHECGLMLAWESQVALHHLDYRVQLNVKYSRFTKKEAKIVPLSFEHIIGIFYMYVLGVALATGLFVVEVVYRRIRRRDDKSQTITVTRLMWDEQVQLY